MLKKRLLFMAIIPEEVAFMMALLRNGTLENIAAITYNIDKKEVLIIHNWHKLSVSN